MLKKLIKKQEVEAPSYILFQSNANVLYFCHWICSAFEIVKCAEFLQDMWRHSAIQLKVQSSQA